MSPPLPGGSDRLSLVDESRSHPWSLYRPRLASPLRRLRMAPLIVSHVGPAAAATGLPLAGSYVPTPLAIAVLVLNTQKSLSRSGIRG